MAPSATDPEPKPEVTTITPKAIATLQKTLLSETNPLALRFRALFSLKHSACKPLSSTNDPIPAISAIASAFASPSALLKHELAYCLGQTRNSAAVPFLRNVLSDLSEDSMVRHEAAEALGALGDESSLELLRSMMGREGEDVSVRETCELAIERIEWEVGRMNEENLKTRFVILLSYIFLSKSWELY